MKHKSKSFVKGSKDDPFRGIAVERCQRCGEELHPDRVEWLELSNTDGKYYRAIPEGHISQGAFPFGQTCATKQLAA